MFPLARAVEEKAETIGAASSQTPTKEKARARQRKEKENGIKEAAPSGRRVRETGRRPRTKEERN